MYKIGFLYGNAAPGNVTPTPLPTLVDIFYDEVAAKWGYTGDKIGGMTSPINIRVTHSTSIAAQLYYKIDPDPLVLNASLDPVANDMIPINSGDIIPNFIPDEYLYFGVSAPTSTITEELLAVTVTNVSLAEALIASFNADTRVDYFALNLNTENSTNDALKVMYTIPMFGVNDTLFYNLPAGTSCTTLGVGTISYPKNSKIYVGVLDTSGSRIKYGVNFNAGFPVPPCPSSHPYCGSFDTNANKNAVYSLTLTQDSYVSVAPELGKFQKSIGC